MFLNKSERKKRHPYCTATVLALAATGAVSIVSCTMEFMREKARCIERMMKKKKDCEQ